jgi:hypothetical protein
LRPPCLFAPNFQPERLRKNTQPGPRPKPFCPVSARYGRRNNSDVEAESYPNQAIASYYGLSSTEVFQHLTHVKTKKLDLTGNSVNFMRRTKNFANWETNKDVPFVGKYFQTTAHRVPAGYE